jgi:hypothetical protein
MLAAALWLAGCPGSGRPATAPVRGRVTLAGQPIAGATVTFLCSGAPRLAVGTTDEQGNYRLTTYEPNDGAVIGTHVVTVKQYFANSDAAGAAIDPSGDPQSVGKAIQGAERLVDQQRRKAMQAGLLVPEKYGSRRTSDLRKQVAAGDNLIDIDLPVKN